MQAALFPEMAKVAAFCAELKLFGFMGVDFFLVEDSRGALKPVFIEMNGRPSSSLNTHLVATKLGAPYWINIDLKSDHEINTFEDFAKHFEGDELLYPQSVPGEGMVIPLSLSSMYTKTDGQYTLVRPDKKVRVMVASSKSMDHCLSILAELSELGFKY
jgi:predicted ATP-grasp superfamily ATP-dependent carboligase